MKRNNQSYSPLRREGRGKSAVLYYVAVFVLLLVIIFSLPGFVGGKRLCNGHGYRNTTDGDCSCDRLHYGDECQYKYCPFGPSWLSKPVQDHVRYSPNVPCSNMGVCNPLTGLCACREGYEGQACQRSCPRLNYVSTGSSQPKLYNEYAVRTNVVASRLSGPVCSGHGRCRTLREAGREFNGRTLRRPSISYSAWDADRIQGCLCDVGYTGFDCSRRECPKGRDPLTSKYDRSETIYLDCQASGGYFALLVLGFYTSPLPFDADPGLLKQALEAISTVGKVAVTMEADSSTYLPTFCGSDTTHRTSVKFLNYTTADLPPIFLTTNTSRTRQWPDSDVSLYSSSSLVFRAVTTWTLSCPTCPYCSGVIYFAYRDSLSDAISITEYGATSLVKDAVLSLTDLFDEGYTNIEVNVTAAEGNYVCSTSAAQTITIEIYSDYGNLPAVTLIDSSYYDTTFSSTANITLSNSKGNGTLFECSNQGFCNATTGVCECLSYFSKPIQSSNNQYAAARNRLSYLTSSSDGNLGPGTAQDCGYVSLTLPSCFLQDTGMNICRNKGVCSNSTHLCTCHDKWSGLTCEVRECPRGPALFDEPIFPDTAHAYAECSNNGHCDHRTGKCSCREGYTGQACEIKDCPRDSLSGIPCSGRGWCFNMNAFASLFGYSYGDAASNRTYPQTWDAFNWFECVCGAKTSSGFLGNPNYPTIAPKSKISGYTSSGEPLVGYAGFDCSLRNCPKGDDVSYRGNYGGLYEKQKVICTSSNDSDAFVLKLFGETSDYIYPYSHIEAIESALEAMKGVGSVTVTWENYTLSETACSSEFSAGEGGFIVQFNTELGDLDLMTAYPSTNVTVVEVVTGSKANLECGGPRMGICDHDVGVCNCVQYQGSSDGDGSVGARGECGHRSTYIIPKLQSDNP